MNDERRVAEDAFVVPLFGGKQPTNEKTRLRNGAFGSSFDGFSKGRERRSIFKDFGVDF